MPVLILVCYVSLHLMPTCQSPLCFIVGPTFAVLRESRRTANVDPTIKQCCQTQQLTNSTEQQTVTQRDSLLFGTIRQLLRLATLYNEAH